MKGILLDRYYKSIPDLRKICICIGVIAFASMFVVENQIFLFALLLFWTAGIFLVVVKNEEKDLNCHWDRYEKMIPVKKWKIEMGKYLFYFVVQMTALIAAISYFALVIGIRGIKIFDYGCKDIATMMAADVVLALVPGAIFYALRAILKIKQYIIIALVSLMVTFVYGVTLVFLLNGWNVSLEISRGVLIGSSLGGYAVSFGVVRLCRGNG